MALIWTTAGASSENIISCTTGDAGYIIEINELSVKQLYGAEEKGNTHFIIDVSYFGF